MRLIDNGNHWVRFNDDGSITYIEAHHCRKCGERIDTPNGERPLVTRHGVEHLAGCQREE